MHTHPEIITLRDIMRFAASAFNANGLYFGHGTDNAWDEAVTLVLHTLHLPASILPEVIDARLTQDEKSAIFNLIDQRVTKRIPLAYLTHEAWFADLPFYVDERVLVPRSPIAELITNHFRPWINIDNVTQILDLCTGSACIAIACAKNFPTVEVDAADISKEALAVAKINVIKHEVENQVHLYQSDLFKGLPAKKYDIIITNPPYVSLEEIRTLPAEYQHEPELGLTAGEHGLDFVVRILQEARTFLKPKGVLIVEVGNSEQSLIKLFPNIPFTWLQFEQGGDGIFAITAEELKKSSASIKL